jgi:transposase
MLQIGMQDRTTITSLSHDELIELVLTLIQQNARLQEENAALRQEIDDLKRRGKRQAAPFSKGEKKANPQPPGRKPGDGPFTRRAAPDPSTYSQPAVDVPVTETACPHCKGALVADGEEVVTRTDIAPPPPPVVRAWRVEFCRCADCGRRVRGRHPDVAADQTGATAHRLGPRLMAAAAVLHYGTGVPVRKLPGIFREFCGIEVTQSALSQDALRRATGAIDTAYEHLRGEIIRRDHLHTDDTGWSINGTKAWLMVFTSDTETIYQVRRRHGNAEVREMIAETYRGVVHTDRFKSYDAKELDAVAQQKCLAHVQKNLSQLIDAQNGRARDLPRALKDHFAACIVLWHERTTTRNYARRAAELQRQADWLLRDRQLSNPANDRMVNELGWHNDRGNLLRFLHEPERAEPTNNEAERALRPAVIARKVSHCSKTDGGADTHAKFTSVIATLVKRGARSIVEAVSAVFSTGTIPASCAD